MAEWLNSSIATSSKHTCRHSGVHSRTSLRHNPSRPLACEYHSALQGTATWYVANVSYFTTATLAALVLIVSCTSQEEDEVLTADDCQEVRQHKAELRMASFHPTGLSEAQVTVERAKHLKNFAALGGQSALDECVETKSRAWVECSIASKSLADAAACK